MLLFFQKFVLEGQVIKKESSKKIAQRTLKNVRFARNSSMIHLDLGKQPLDAGTRSSLQDVLFTNKMNNSLGLFNETYD